MCKTRRKIFVLLLPIKPSYMRKIREGKKRIEIRKQHPKKSFSYILFYETSPVSKITCIAKKVWVKSINRKDIRKYSKDIGLPLHEINKYLNGHKRLVLIKFASPFFLESPLSLKKLGISYTPQSFVYLDSRKISKTLGTEIFH